MIPKAQWDLARTAQHTAQAKSLEEELDRMIAKNDPTPSLDVSAATKEAIEIIKKRYEDGGWTVRHESNQHDGATIYLS